MEHQAEEGSPRCGYRMALVQLDDEGPPIRVKVVMLEGKPGMIARWSESCSGCTPTYEERGGAPAERGIGCHECGYTGRRRHVMWVPLPEAANYRPGGKVLRRVLRRVLRNV